MSKENPKVFISYSWDSDEHKEWVANLANELRKNGVYADFDRNITQQGTINLNRMMIENFRSSDYIIVVLTENYAERANEYRGGVGLETTFLGNELLNNMQKLILVKRSKANDNEVVPYLLNGIIYTDFSDDSKFNDALNEILHKIFKVNEFELDPIGARPNLTTRKIGYGNEKNINKDNMDDLIPNLIPNLRGITDLDRKKFINDSYNYIYKSLVDLSERTKQANSNFDFMEDKYGTFNNKLTFYVDRSEKTCIRLWVSDSLGFNNSILISYDMYNMGSNSFNECIMCKEKENELKLSMTFNSKENCNSKDIVKALWNNICERLKY